MMKATSLLLAWCLLSYFSRVSAQLQVQFVDPPADARPMMRWWWFGIAAEKPEIRRELEQMKADGIGGAELAFVYPQTLKGNEPFLSKPMLESVRYAESEARRLGLRLDVTLGSGWPYGGPATTLDQAAWRLRTVNVQSNMTAKAPPRVLLAKGETVISRTTTQTFLASHTGQKVKRASVGAEGWVLDPFSREAVATHLHAVGEPLVNAFGATPPYAVFSDSLEAYGADWTPNLPAEFARRRGYDLLPHLPELVAGGTTEAANVRHDWGQTLTELVDENYLSQINAWAHAHHTKFRSQTYGDPAVILSSQRLVDLAEGEHPYWRTFSTLRWATSANHLFHRNVSSAETFTWLHSPVFRATPLDIKAEADLDFLLGVNQLIGHGWPYSPPAAGEPGWSLYAAAVFNDHNPWHPVMPEVTRYLQRMSFLLRQGEPANQVAVLLPTDDAWAHFSPGKVSVTAEMEELIPPAMMSAILSAGYNVDFIDAEAVERIGIHYPILILPPTDRLPEKTRLSIERYVAGGGKAIAVGRAPSLNEHGGKVAASPSIALTDEQGLTEALHRAAPPDFSVDSAKEDVGFIRRKLANQDIYFVANTANHPVSVQAHFASTHTFGQRWDVDSGAAVAAVRETAHLDLAPYESGVFVFGDTPLPTTKSSQPGAQIEDLSAGWTIAFPGELPGTEKKSVASVPADWANNAATRFYSGEAKYSRKFTLDQIPAGGVFLEIQGGTPVAKPDGIKGPGMRAWYDPPVREAAIVFLNGRRVAALWHPPYRIDAGGFLKPGENQIEIKVYNTAINAWASRPPRNYVPLIARYGERFQMQDLDGVKPVPSGLMGTVRLVEGRR
jgi:alpha-L-rhamnosidase